MLVLGSSRERQCGAWAVRPGFGELLWASPVWLPKGFVFDYIKISMKGLGDS